MGLAPVVINHTHSPRFQIDGSALCGLKEGVVVLGLLAALAATETIDLQIVPWESGAP